MIALFAQQLANSLLSPEGQSLSVAAPIIGYWLVTAACIVWCAIGGGRPERLATVVVCCGLAATQLATPIEFSGWRIGVAVVDSITLVGLLVLAIRFDRWWLIWAAAAQLVTVLTHLVGWVSPDLLLRTNVEVRWILGLMLLAIMGLGPFEARRLAQDTAAI